MIPGKPAENKVNKANPNLTNVESMPKYLATPPHTPESMQSVVERVSFLFIFVTILIIICCKVMNLEVKCINICNVSNIYLF